VSTGEELPCTQCTPRLDQGQLHWRQCHHLSSVCKSFCLLSVGKIASLLLVKKDVKNNRGMLWSATYKLGGLTAEAAVLPLRNSSKEGEDVQ